MVGYDANMETCGRSSEHIQGFIDAYPDPVVVVDASGLMVAANDLAMRLFDYSRKEIIGQDPGLLISGATDVDAVSQALDADYISISRTRSGRQLRGRRRDGSEFPSEISIRQVTVDAERFSVASIRDITVLREAEAQQREAERIFALGIEHSPIGVVLTDVSGRLTRVNPAACVLLGRCAEELLGHRLPEFVHPLDSGDTPLYEQAVREGAKNLCEERRYMRPDGEAVCVEQIVVLLRDSHGQPDSFYVHLQDITARKSAESELQELALHDPLTGLANRRLMTEHLAHSVARANRIGRQVAVLFIDVDQFKLINDARGHTTGDELLLQLARRLQDLTRQSDLLARFGGDEFVIVCDDMSVEGAQKFASRIAAASDEPFTVDGEEIFTNVSIGIAFSEPGDTAESLVRKSDVAMYAVKDGGRDGAAIFEELMQQKATRRMTTESQLRGALRRDEFRLRFQPILNLRTGMPAGFEALVRWEHPERGLLPPSEFLPVAHETGLIVDIDKWVLHHALRQLSEWDSHDPDVRNLTMAVNLSTRQLHEPSCITFAEEMLTQTGLEPHRLHFEITEAEVMYDIDVAIQHMNQAAELGVRFGIDDFGVGHSALSYLHRLPMHTLKIDKSFVAGLSSSDPRPAFIVETIINLAHTLSLDVIAEGVELEAQLEELLRLDSDKAQGYLWAKPLAANEVPEWLVAVSVPG